MSENYNFPDCLHDNEIFKEFIRNTFISKSADIEREIFVKCLKGMLCGNQDTRNYSRDCMNVYLNQETSSYNGENV